MIEAIVLAAGESRRMGLPKPLLRFGATTFLEQIIGTLHAGEVDGITVVLGARADMIRASTDLSGVKVVVNENWGAGQLSSLTAGLSRVSEETEAVLLCLVDHPFVTADVVGHIIEAFRRTRRPIVIPVVDGRRGHPALFARAVFDELRHVSPDEGARSVVNADRTRVLEVEVADKAVLTRIDTPEDYRRYFGMAPQIGERR